MLKMDFLGLKTLTVIHDAVVMVKARHGELKNPETGEVYETMDDVPLDDPAVYRMLAKGGTSGVFQFESSLANDKLRVHAVRPLRRPGGHQRPHPPRAAGLGHDRRLHRPEARPRGSHVPASRPGEDAGADVRRHRLPGTGDAGSPTSWRASRWARPTCSARRWARRTPSSSGRSSAGSWSAPSSAAWTSASPRSWPSRSRRSADTASTRATPRPTRWSRTTRRG